MSALAFAVAALVFGAMEQVLKGTITEGRMPKDLELGGDRLSRCMETKVISLWTHTTPAFGVTYHDNHFGRNVGMHNTECVEVAIHPDDLPSMRATNTNAPILCSSRSVQVVPQFGDMCAPIFKSSCPNF